MLALARIHTWHQPVVSTNIAKPRVRAGASADAGDKSGTSLDGGGSAGAPRAGPPSVAEVACGMRAMRAASMRFVAVLVGIAR